MAEICMGASNKNKDLEQRTMAVLAAKGLNDKTVGFHKLTNKSRRAESNNECKITKLSLLCNKEIGDCNQRERDRTNKHGEVNRA